MVINVFLIEKYIQLLCALFPFKYRIQGAPSAAPGEASVLAVVAAPRAKPRAQPSSLRPGKTWEAHSSFAPSASPPCGLLLKPSALLINITAVILLQTLSVAKCIRIILCS